MPLITATGATLEHIMDGTYPIWNEGLSREAYSRWNRGQTQTAWGREALKRVALVDGQTVLSSAKSYSFDGLIGGQRVPVLGIGAVFTPVESRGRGHARTLLEEMMADAAARGSGLALLFSEIGASFYESLGFRVVPRSTYLIEVLQGRRAGAPATLVRSGEAGDLAALAAITARYHAGSAFALDRTSDLIGFGLARRRLLAGLGPAGRREVEFFVAEEAQRAVAYVVITRVPQGLVLEDCGDYDPAGARVGAILQVMAARDPSAPPMRLHGWLPRSFRPPQIRIVHEQPAGEIMMVRPLGSRSPTLDEAGETVYWNLDVF
jgi:ribosomal protein S18 acetylase RimI-like enzyme